MAGWALIALLSIAVGLLTQPLDGWMRMILLVGVLFTGFKAFALPRRNRLAFITLWPGMDPRPFELDHPTRSWSLARAGLGRMLLGAGLLLVPAPLAVKGWLVVAAFLLMVHLGLFDLLAAFWRAVGRPVGRISPSPWLSTSLTEFWAHRWNMAFHIPVRNHAYKPLARRWGRVPAVAAVFLLSGLLHEFVTSLPAEGGWGLPTLYFAIHGMLVLLEKTGVLRPRRWLTILFVVLPLPLLVHAPFLRNVIYPMVSP